MYEKMAKVHKIDRKIGRKRLRFHRSACFFDSVVPSKKYALIPAGSSRGVFHVMQRNLQLPYLHPDICRMRAVEKLYFEALSRLSDIVGLCAQILYVQKWRNGLHSTIDTNLCKWF